MYGIILFHSRKSPRWIANLTKLANPPPQQTGRTSRLLSRAATACGRQLSGKVVRRHARTPIATVLLVTLLAVGCRQTALATPEELVRHALEAVQQRDEAAFFDICATHEDILAATCASPTMSAEEQAQVTAAVVAGIGPYTWSEVRQLQRENFWRVCDAADWTGAVIQSYDVAVEDARSPSRADELAVWLTISGRRVGLFVDDPILAPRGWCTAEPQPLRAHFDDRRTNVVK